jgi:hypothetical protein
MIDNLDEWLLKAPVQAINRRQGGATGQSAFGY